MKPNKIDGVEVWKDFEDLAARLALNVIERAVYSHLLLHTRLELNRDYDPWLLIFERDS